MQIGLVLLIALSAKNAILIVEMAREGRAAGKDILEAMVHASKVRFRPILMTSFTFILGVLPLVLASGAGASARRSLGIAVASGMLASTCLAVLFVPRFSSCCKRGSERRENRRRAVSDTGYSRTREERTRARQILHRAAGARERPRACHDAARRSGAVQSAGGAISRPSRRRPSR